MMNVNIRKFEKQDIPYKVKWINNPENNTFLHYELPLEIEKTEIWFEKNKDRGDRHDAVIEVDGTPVGLIGLLSIDTKNKKAEYYVTLGERAYWGKGVANKASALLLTLAFTEFGLNRVYLYTETENLTALKLYERIGFKREGLLKNDLFHKGHFVDRYVYGITKDDFLHRVDTPIYEVDAIGTNRFFMKREDLLPFSFGGNKARKAQLFFEEIDHGNYDCIVTYGSSSSNHCRVIANMAAARKLPCYIISPEESSGETYNSTLMTNLGVQFTLCPVDKVRETIDNKLSELKKGSQNPYFIAGGGHGIIGTQAYVNCYEEIRRFEQQANVHFDYIFHASGTGTTQAGLICGQLIHRDERRIIGISIARQNTIGRNVVIDSVREYFDIQKIRVVDESVENATVFLDDYVGGGYGAFSNQVTTVISDVMTRYGIPLDATYTGKAFAGMLDYIEKSQIEHKNILFIHTGGTPLYFDYLTRKKL